MASNYQWRELIPRKLRRVSNGKQTQYLISVPNSVAEQFDDDAVFIVHPVEVNGEAIGFSCTRIKGEQDVRS